MLPRMLENYIQRGPLKVQSYEDRADRSGKSREFSELTIEELLAELEEEYKNPLDSYPLPDVTTSSRSYDDEFSHLDIDPIHIKQARAEHGSYSYDPQYPYSNDHIPQDGHTYSPPSRNANVWGVITAAAVLVVALQPGDHSLKNGSPLSNSDNPSLFRIGGDNANPLFPGKDPKVEPKGGWRDLSKLSYDEYVDLIRKAGGQVHPSGIPSVLAIRYDRSINTLYNDLFVVLTKDKKVVVLQGSTHPSQESHPKFMNDVNGDGLHDVGIVKPGNYLAIPNGEHAGYDSFHIVRYDATGKIIGSLPGWRSTKRDGKFSKKEMVASDARGDTVNEILIHAGGRKGANSVGCQTLSPENLDRLIKAVGGPKARFTYTLIDKPEN